MYVQDDYNSNEDVYAFDSAGYEGEEDKGSFEVGRSYGINLDGNYSFEPSKDSNEEEKSGGDYFDEVCFVIFPQKI